MNLIKSMNLLILCALPLSLHATDAYVAPQENLSSLASLMGSQAEGSTKKPVRVFILGVDGKKIEGKAREWDRPVHVSPGKHMIALGIGDLLYEEFEIDACAGCTFTARATYAEASKGMIKITNTQAWISKDPESEVVTEMKPGKPRPRDVKFTVIRY